MIGNCPVCDGEMIRFPSGLRACLDCDWFGDEPGYYQAWAEKLDSRPCACQVYGRGYWFVIGLILGIIIGFAIRGIVS